MGCNTIITLPADVRVGDVSEVMGILAGLPAVKEAANYGKPGTWYVRVPGAVVKSTSTPEMCLILLTCEGDRRLIDGEKSHLCHFHFESMDGENPCRTVTPPSTPFWIAVGRRLVKFFGGKIIYNDCGDRKVNFRAPYPKISNHAEEGKPWYDLQEKIANTVPLTKADLRAALKWAVYKDVGLEPLDN